mmetsp:Transcript_80345/g.126867  ORF Transcript_80345/g.126867 Transcript_80345/m.126867 type:complete len:222 (+) Transcript_80345:2218-2883(+)
MQLAGHSQTNGHSQGALPQQLHPVKIITTHGSKHLQPPRHNQATASDQAQAFWKLVRLQISVRIQIAMDRGRVNDPVKFWNTTKELAKFFDLCKGRRGARHLCCQGAHPHQRPTGFIQVATLQSFVCRITAPHLLERFHACRSAIGQVHGLNLCQGHLRLGDAKLCKQGWQMLLHVGVNLLDHVQSIMGMLLMTRRKIWNWHQDLLLRRRSWSSFGWHGRS